MENRRFGPSTSDVSIIGQGTWFIGRSGRAAAVAALRRGLDLGMSHIDTAEMYDDAEDVVGEAIAGRRDDVFLVSKVLPQNASRAGTIAASSARWHGSVPTASTAISFTGAAAIRSRRRLPRSSGCGATARSTPGASATSTSPISTRRWRWPARIASRAIRSSTTSRNATSSAI